MFCSVSCLAGCPRVTGDDDESFDGEDFDEEFPVKSRLQGDHSNLNPLANGSVIFSTLFTYKCYTVKKCYRAHFDSGLTIYIDGLYFYLFISIYFCCTFLQDIGDHNNNGNQQQWQANGYAFSVGGSGNYCSFINYNYDDALERAYVFVLRNLINVLYWIKMRSCW